MNFEIGECLMACLEENTFQCHSVSYDWIKKLCRLNEANKHSLGSYLAMGNQYIVYFDMYKIGL